MGRPGLQILKPGPYHGGPDPNPTRPEKAQTSQVQGLSQFYLKMLIILTLVHEKLLSCVDSRKTGDYSLMRVSHHEVNGGKKKKLIGE